jgi:hypothetical protein
MSEDQCPLICEIRIVLVVIGMPVRVNDHSYRSGKGVNQDYKEAAAGIALRLHLFSTEAYRAGMQHNRWLVIIDTDARPSTSLIACGFISPLRETMP